MLQHYQEASTRTPARLTAEVRTAHVGSCMWTTAALRLPRRTLPRQSQRRRGGHLRARAAEARSAGGAARAARRATPRAQRPCGGGARLPARAHGCGRAAALAARARAAPGTCARAVRLPRQVELAHAVGLAHAGGAGGQGVRRLALAHASNTLRRTRGADCKRMRSMLMVRKGRWTWEEDL